MKILDPSAVPQPDRKPEPPPARASADGGFKAALAASQAGPLPARKPEPPVQLANGQKAPPLPAAKPSVPLLLAGGQPVPVPGRKPDAPVAVAVAPPAPGRKPDAPPAPEDTDAGRIALASRQVARLSGHSFGAILAQATMESGLNPAAKSRTSSAAGPFQFLERTWLDLFRRHGAAYGLGDLARQVESRNGLPVVRDPAVRRQILELRHDVDVSAGMAARYLAEGRERLSQRLKRPVSETESRIAYIMGVGGAAKLIRAAERTPHAPAPDLLPAAARANRPLFYDTASGRPLGAQEAVARLAHRMANDQRELFAAIDRAAEPPVVLDGRPSPLNPFQSAGGAVEEDTAGRAFG